MSWGSQLMYFYWYLESVEKHAIDIILATDDVISMGYRESVTIQEVEQQLKMESAEEKAHLALVKQQEEDAKMAAQKAGGRKWVLVIN